MKIVLILYAASLTLFPPAQDPPPIFSNLPLELLGIVINSGSPAKSVCLIRFALPPKNIETVRPGERAFELAEIQKIDSDGVVIKNLVSNSLEYLTFLKNRPFPHHPPSIPSSPQVTAISADRINMNISADVLDHYTNNLSEILDSAYAAPHFRKEKDGKQSIEGFEISRIKKGGIADRLSLQNGDIVLAVNGETMDSLEKVMKLVSQVQNMPQAVITVLRGTQKIKIAFTRKYSGSNLGPLRDAFGGQSGFREDKYAK
jgi:type II secretory pathway component PulC